MLSDVIEAALSGSAHLWFEGLAEQLARNTWDGLIRAGQTPNQYGTQRLLTNNPTADRLIAGSIAVSVIDMPPIGIELLDEAMVSRYGELRFGSPSEAERARPAFEAAIDLLERVPTLAQSVGYLVRSLHVLSAGPEFDVSYSDPEVPFSIFVSIPRENEAHARMRLAEQIVHESMHLQLTLIERAIPMVSPTDIRLYSPWQGRPRSVQGLLHGLYVFGVISAFFEALNPHLATADRHFAKRRCSQIASEIASVQDITSTLTRHGRELALRLHAQTTARF